MKSCLGALSRLALAFAAPAAAQTDVRFADLAGWWTADPVHGGESSHVALQFVEKDGKPEARLSIPRSASMTSRSVTVTISGNSIDTKGLSFPLTWNPASQTLSWHLPADVVPVYNVPVEFNRSAAHQKPAPRDWKAPRPKVVWSVDTGAPVWAGLERADRRHAVRRQRAGRRCMPSTATARCAGNSTPGSRSARSRR